MLRLGPVNFHDELTSVLPLDRTERSFPHGLSLIYNHPGFGLKFRSIFKLLIVLQMLELVLVNALINITKIR